MALEKVVRPFQTPILTPTARNITAISGTPETVIMQFGKSARGRVGATSYSLSVTRYMTKQQKETCED